MARLEKITPLISGIETRLPFYAVHAAAYKRQGEIIAQKGYPDYQWVYSTHGKGLLIIHGEEYIISENTGFLIFPNVPYEYRPIYEPWKTKEFSFNGHCVSSMLEILEINESKIFKISNYQLLENLFNDIYISIQAESHIRGLKCSADLYRFLVEIKNFTDTDLTRHLNAKMHILEPVISFIGENYLLTPSIEEMAALINVSIYQLNYLFKKIYNITPSEYVIRLKLRKAKEMLIDSDDLLIKDIAQEIGYKNTSYFCAVFKEHEGMTPAEFKRLYKNQ